jgi:hypothetical protein
MALLLLKGCSTLNESALDPAVTTLEITLKDEAGNVIPGAEVFLFASKRQFELLAGYARFGLADSEGVVRFENLNSEPYFIYGREARTDNAVGEYVLDNRDGFNSLGEPLILRAETSVVIYLTNEILSASEQFNFDIDSLHIYPFSYNLQTDVASVEVFTSYVDNFGVLLENTSFYENDGDFNTSSDFPEFTDYRQDEDGLIVPLFSIIDRELDVKEYLSFSNLNKGQPLLVEVSINLLDGDQIFLSTSIDLSASNLFSDEFFTNGVERLAYPKRANLNAEAQLNDEYVQLNVFGLPNSTNFDINLYWY